MVRILRTLPALAACALACETPPVAPGLDQYSCDGGICPDPGVIEGSVVYNGTARGDAVLLLFDTAALPPPDGTGTTPAAIARVPEATLLPGSPGVGPFSASFTFTQVPSGRSYQIRAFIDAAHQFNPFFDYARQPHAGDPIGGYGDPGGPGEQPRLLTIGIEPGQAVAGITVAFTQTLPYDPPSFELSAGSQILDQNMDRPVRIQLRENLGQAPGSRGHHGARTRWQDRGRHDATPDEIREQGVGHVPAPRRARRGELRHDVVPVRDEDRLALRREPHVLAQLVLQRLDPDDPHGHHCSYR
jgi:hypothetical protein